MSDIIIVMGNNLCVVKLAIWVVEKCWEKYQIAACCRIFFQNFKIIREIAFPTRIAISFSVWRRKKMKKKVGKKSQWGVFRSIHHAFSDSYAHGLEIWATFFMVSYVRLLLQLFHTSMPIWQRKACKSSVFYAAIGEKWND